MDILGRMVDFFVPDFLIKRLANREPIEIGLFGPSRIGKTTLIASMVEEFKGYTDHQRRVKKDCLTLVADKNTNKILSRKISDLTAGIDGGAFKPGTLSSTSSKETFELKLSSYGDDNFNPVIRFNDFPGGWVTDPNRLDELKIKDWNIVIIPVDAAVIMENSQKKRIGQARELLGVNQVESFVGKWIESRNDKKPGLCIFAPVKCETYFTMPAMASFLGDQSQVLLNRTKEYYEDSIKQLEGYNNISCLYMPVNTVGCCFLREAFWEDDEFRTVYRISRQPGKAKWLPYGPANIVLEICKFIAKIIRLSNIDTHAYKHFLNAVFELDNLMADARYARQKDLDPYSRQQILN